MVALLEGLGDPRTAADEDSVTDWVAHESPWNDSYPDGALYTRNPLNSKLAVPGSELLVTGVEQYPSMTAGLDATIATLHDGWYPDILYQLHAGAGLVQDASAGLLKWSDGAYSSV